MRQEAKSYQRENGVWAPWQELSACIEAYWKQTEEAKLGENEVPHYDLRGLDCSYKRPEPLGS